MKRRLERTPAGVKRGADQARRAEAVGRVWKWAFDPVNDDNALAVSMRAVLEECRRFADLTPRIEELRTEVELLRAHNRAYQRKLAVCGRG